ncbi:MAG: hypothetical protein E6K75_08535 [Candidatus Eisenbacteria bacterium]|uniref:Uncharacterized protein n=1 Tax=Eiseniibacteriota bacterium TaxID=2212470 RepID=A0A538SYM7_UNCEI|nr:MAG: hypothetical protein E6K75_08535 [Candidatus Eisenbacteria bacterium]
MTRMILLVLGLSLAIGIASIAFGTAVPTSPGAGSPYYSSLSNMAVSTAEACPCNLKLCSGDTICWYTGDIDHPTFCCLNNGHCVTGNCFP